MTLTIHGDQPLTVFRLSGANENSGTLALGWVMDQSSHYLSVVVEAVFNEALDVTKAVIALQRYGQDRGYTDLEIQAGNRFHAILEAKRWWAVPDVQQLTRYLPRLVASTAERKRLISVSSADRAYATHRLPTDLGGVPIVHLSWADLQRLANRARALASSFQEKLWLSQLIGHLQEFVNMERRTDNNVYVVSVGTHPMVEGQTPTWIDVVER